MSVYFGQGNHKIDKACLVFSLPTHICYGKGKQCKKCYATQAEYMYPACLPSRERNYTASLSDTFVSEVNNKLKKTRKKIVRIHEAGDFYSQEYVDKWTEIAKNNPNIFFFALTKKCGIFDFSEFKKLPNTNIVDSFHENKLNYGTKEYCEELQKKGYVLCPCGTDKETKCMKNCFICLSEEKVCFIQH